jgi:hypothetical protein
MGTSMARALGSRGATVDRDDPHDGEDLVGLRRHSRPAIRCPGIELPPTFDDYIAMFPSRRRSNLRRIRSSFAASRRYLDFTRGSEPFKYQYGAARRGGVGGAGRGEVI